MQIYVGSSENRNNSDSLRFSNILLSDVISGLSLHSVDLDDIPDAMSPIMGRTDSTGLSAHSAVGRRKSVGKTEIL